MCVVAPSDSACTHPIDFELLRNCHNGSFAHRFYQASPMPLSRPLPHVCTQLQSTDACSYSSLRLQVTLLAAGFVIGPSGHSVRAICERSGANIQVCLRCVPMHRSVSAKKPLKPTSVRVPTHCFEL